MPRILSGVQPTGNLHLGNYVGAFRQWVDMQHDFEALYPVVDLHAITLAYDHKELADRTLEVAALLLAAGLDPDVCTIFVQSHVPEHTELAWLLNHLATVGELRRMTQFKAKAETGGEGALPAGYFNYPVLQAADILIYQADRGAGGGGPAPAPGADPRRGRALQRPLRPDLRGPRGLHPQGRRPGHGPPAADGQDVEVERVAGRSHRGPRPARGHPAQGPLGRDRLGPRGAGPARQAGHLQPAGAVLGGHRQGGRGAGAGLRRPRLRRLQGRSGRRPDRLPGPGPGALPRAPRRPGPPAGHPRAGRGQAQAIARENLARPRTGWGSCRGRAADGEPR